MLDDTSRSRVQRVGSFDSGGCGSRSIEGHRGDGTGVLVNDVKGKSRVRSGQ
jgi:hypothetical protein